ncbi:WLM domain-containing protein [Daedaleopsis nitida]|nr:WLM domain-containing protein [Daedaleopsis nitida]
MVHVRLNDREANPNPHINFITPLKMVDAESEEEARQLLRALAAQVRPIMKAAGFVVNSFEEYEHNQVFAGRNWNNGEVVELVLRGAGGSFLPTSWLLSTLCHELAHIKHMNHGPAFQALWTKLRNDVRELQSKGYYGDGYWSSGNRLMDSARIGGQGLDAGDLPEYMCGGAQTRTRPTALRRRRRQAGPSNHTGAQTAKKRKAGTRVTAKGLFQGSGRALNDDVEDEEQKKAGAGFRKKAGSKRARDERALAAERRLLALREKGGDSTETVKNEDGDSDDDYENAPETDQERRHAMLDSADKAELDGLKAWQHDYSSEFIFPPAAPFVASSSSSRNPESTPGRSPKRNSSRRDNDLARTGTASASIEISSDEDDAPSHGCDTQLLHNGGTAATTVSRKGKQRERPFATKVEESRDGITTSNGLRSMRSDVDKPRIASSTHAKKQSKLSYGVLVHDEVQQRKKEALGMDGPGRRLGGAGGPPSESLLTDRPPASSASRESQILDEPPSPAGVCAVWTCQVCTLLNEPLHLACSACATPRGGTNWAGDAV